MIPAIVFRIPLLTNLEIKMYLDAISLWNIVMGVYTGYDIAYFLTSRNGPFIDSWKILLVAYITKHNNFKEFAFEKLLPLLKNYNLVIIYKSSAGLKNYYQYINHKHTFCFFVLQDLNIVYYWIITIIAIIWFLRLMLLMIPIYGWCMYWCSTYYVANVNINSYFILNFCNTTILKLSI